MPTPWTREVLDAKKLRVFNKGGAWSGVVSKAVSTFNTLALGVTLELEKVETEADIVVVLANAAMTYPYKGRRQYPDEKLKTSTRNGFRPDILHGYCHTLTRLGRRGTPGELFFATIFLPGKVQATNEQKEVIIIHEFIHASGLDGGMADGAKNRDQDHELVGIMYDTMMTDGKGLRENLKSITERAMPPIRVGPSTTCKLARLWAGAETC
jgi:hypothetical protein